jgi:succinoglycan biosynthesis transport protein ExoP
VIRNKRDREINEQSRGEQPSTFNRYARFTLAEPASWSRVLLKYWSWILLMTFAVTASAGVVAEMRTRIYTAQADVAVYPMSSAGGSALQPFVMGTEKGIVSSGAVLSIVSQSLLIPVSKLQHGLSVSVPVDTNLLQISFSDPNPHVAQTVAEAIAEAYVVYGTSKALPTASGNASATASAAGAAVLAVVITDAALPTSPDGPSRLLIVGVALIVGLTLGIGLALVSDMLDDGLRGPLDLQTQAETPVLAQIPAFHRKRHITTDDLVIVRNPGSPVAEAYRNLRTRVLQVAAWGRGNVLLVTSPGREDKSTVAANLAAALALSGKKVVLVCADLRWGRADALFGVDNRPGLANVVNGDAKLAAALRTTEVPRLQVLPGGQADFDPSSVLQSFRNLLHQLQSEADFVVIDAPPVLASADTAVIAELGALILLVADARASSRAEVRTATHELGHVHDCLIGCVLDNVGRARRFGDAPRPAVMTGKQGAGISSGLASPGGWGQNIVVEPVDSDRGPMAAPVGVAPPDLSGRHETTSIKGNGKGSRRANVHQASQSAALTRRRSAETLSLPGSPGATEPNIVVEAADSEGSLTIEAFQKWRARVPRQMETPIHGEE